jgi:predicted DNA-binding transcriptional regulator AlpA
MTDKLLNRQETSCKLGGRSRSSLYNDVAAGRLPPPIKIGGRIYWSQAQLDAHIAALRDRAG